MGGEARRRQGGLADVAVDILRPHRHKTDARAGPGAEGKRPNTAHVRRRQIRLPAIEAHLHRLHAAAIAGRGLFIGCIPIDLRADGDPGSRTGGFIDVKDTSDRYSTQLIGGDVNLCNAALLFSARYFVHYLQNFVTEHYNATFYCRISHPCVFCNSKARVTT